MILSANYRHGLGRESKGSWTVDAVKQVSYDVLVRRDLLKTGDPFLAEALRGCVAAAGNSSDRRLLVVDEVVDTIYGSEIDAYFSAHGFHTSKLVIDAHEQVKNWASVDAVLAAMDGFGVDRRREPVIAIGGGVLCDVVGFAASIYRRGTPYVRIPTTLIGLVDAGVGVKTGVNHRAAKNRIGTYAQPLLSLLDTRFLTSLPVRHLGNGMAEILKVALVKSRPLFEYVEQASLCDLKVLFEEHKHTDVADYVIEESIHLMLEELQPNLWEGTLERCVDYGHTFSPTIEMHAVSELLHGEAVAIDMALTTGIALDRGLMREAEAVRVLDVITGLGLQPWNDVLKKQDLLVAALEDTVRHRDGLQRLPLTSGIGEHVFVNDVSAAQMAAGAAFVESYAGDLAGWQESAA
ncbi:2-epi-5-epi-valiolone synthase [Streptomyces sp. 150FB]|uniref:sedoheptulose 7-phosphate cyclase n=1 Tax=Streptomyces sp. 150FB TaxID=1576605 RepID=UPI0005893AE7|nr:sedoheptulose 7-phosphate cyclase [Streptomyces sp. 150FB]KIF75078.1 2-epi-5-epi-valiolone synthase [Streptomyces sp. 150FB]